jgi:hypothetical protein
MLETPNPSGKVLGASKGYLTAYSKMDEVLQEWVGFAPVYKFMDGIFEAFTYTSTFSVAGPCFRDLEVHGDAGVTFAYLPGVVFGAELGFCGLVARRAPRHEREALEWLTAFWDKVGKPELEGERRRADLCKPIGRHDVVLHGSCYEEIVNDVEQFLASRKLYEEELGIPWKRGLVFHGPPGNGKTCMIRTLSQIFNLTVRDVMDYYSRGRLDFDQLVSTASVWSYFDDSNALTARPRIVALEDIDRLSHRTLDGHQALDLRELLNALDGITHVRGVLFIATTNNPEDIQDAVMNRPGRFDARYAFPRPGVEEAERFLSSRRLCVQGGEHEEGLHQLAETAVQKNMSFAHLQEWVIRIKRLHGCNKAPLDACMEVAKGITVDDDELTDKMGFQHVLEVPHPKRARPPFKHMRYTT